MKIEFVNLWIPMLILLPNLLVVIREPTNIPDKPANEPIIYRILERIGQMGFFLLPLFLTWAPNTFLKRILLILMFASLLLYYLCWIRFIIHSFNYKYLYLPLLRVPIPMAIFPVFYLCFSAFILESYLMISIIILFSV
jgi:hypothetical protein